MPQLDFREANPKCNGCPVLDKPLPTHTILDYEYQEECDILFLSDHPKLHEGEYVAFRSQEYVAITKALVALDINLNDWKVAFSTSVKCPGITMDTLTPAIRKTCQAHLHDTIDQLKPKLIFACGQVASTMVYGKVKMHSKVRGKADSMKTEKGHEFRFVPIIHPFQVVSEPKNAYLFRKDIENAINSELLHRSTAVEVPYNLVMSIEELDKVKDKFIDTTKDIAVDIEATGLNFLSDTIHTISLTRLDSDTNEILETIVLPIDHKEAKLGYKIKGAFLDFIVKVMANKKNRKILQGANYDLKFLKRYGVEEVNNIFDTKLLQHLYNEEVPKGLADLVYYYIPKEEF